MNSNTKNLKDLTLLFKQTETKHTRSSEYPPQGYCLKNFMISKHMKEVISTLAKEFACGDSAVLQEMVRFYLETNRKAIDTVYDAKRRRKLAKNFVEEQCHDA